MTPLGPVLAGWMLLGVTSVACQVSQTSGRPTNERLRGVRSQQDSVNWITAYGRSMRDTGFVVDTGSGDEQRLRDCRTPPCKYGPLAVIQPRYRITDSGSTTLTAGEVIARIINRSDTGYIYRVGKDTSYKFNLHARDTVYWWVGRRGDSLVSVFLSSKRGAPPVVSDLTQHPHPRGYWKQPLARWIWDEGDEKGWGTCDGGVCCQSSGIPQ